MLKQSQLLAIQEAIQTELLKRGFSAPITLSQKIDERYSRIELESEPFQTTPVIFKTIRVRNFSGNMKKDTAIHKNIKKEEFEVNVVSFYIPVSVSYEHFDLGSNGSGLFSFSGYVTEDSDQIFQPTIK